jgi:hypothetical protein
MPHLSRSTVQLFLAASLLQALDGWALVAERAGYSAPPAVGGLFLHDALQRQAEKLAEVDALRERRRRVHELATAVADGRLTLYEAAARLRATYQAVPGFFWEGAQRRFPGASDEECSCRLMIREVRNLQGPRRERAQAVATRLEAELDEVLRRGQLRKVYEDQREELLASEAPAPFRPASVPTVTEMLQESWSCRERIENHQPALNDELPPFAGIGFEHHQR